MTSGELDVLNAIMVAFTVGYGLALGFGVLIFIISKRKPN